MKKTVKIAIIILLILVLIVILAFVILKFIDNYKFEETVKNNLSMLTDAKEDSQNEYIANNSDDSYDIPLTFTIEEIYSKGENWEGIDYKIVPSYNKDFSKWTREDKEAYNKICAEANARAEARHNEEYERQKNEISEIEKMLNEEMANQWEVSEYEGVGTIEYNINTTLVKGDLMGQAFDTTYEDFIDVVAPGILANMHSIVDYGRDAEGNYSGLTEEQWFILDAMTSLENLVENMRRVVILRHTPDGEDPPF